MKAPAAFDLHCKITSTGEKLQNSRGKEKKITKQLQNGAAGAGADKLQINLGVIVSSSDEIAS